MRRGVQAWGAGGGWWRLAALLVVALLAGCAGVAQQTEPQAAPGEETEAERELERLFGEQRAAFEARFAEPVMGEDGCPGLCESQAQICGLAERICALAARHPGSRRGAELCEEAEATCAEVRTRLATRCACALPEP